MSEYCEDEKLLNDLKLSTPSPPEDPPPPLPLLIAKHTKYLARSLNVMPSHASSFDTSRMTIAFFGLCGLDILGRSDLIADQKDRAVQWIKRLYVASNDGRIAGFHGGTFLRSDETKSHLHPDAHCGHIAMTYTALACLKAMGVAPEYLEFDTAALLRGVRALQRTDGSFNSSLEGGEHDMRFVFCAAAVCRMLGDEDCSIGMDVDAACDYVLSSISYDGGIGQGPMQEAHGGSTYCAVATLALTRRLDKALGPHRFQRLCRWCVNRLQDGFCGRPNKPGDTCYTFWVGATLKLLRPFEQVEDFIAGSTSFVLETQDSVIGGLSKWVDNTPDPLHTYLGLGGLALAGYEGLADFDPALNVTKTRLIKSVASAAES